MTRDDKGRTWVRRAVIRTAVVAAAATLLGVGPALAHEAPAATPVVQPAPGGPAVGAGPGTAGPVAMEASTSDVEERGWYVLAVMGGLAVGALALRVLLPFFRQGAEPRPVDDLAAAALIFTGVVHCALVPEHWAEGWVLGAFFAVSGVLLIGQAVLVWLQPSRAAYGSVIVSTTVLIVLYFLAREVTIPLVDHLDPYSFEEYPVKVAEGLAALLAVAALVRGRMGAGGRRLAAR